MTTTPFDHPYGMEVAPAALVFPVLSDSAQQALTADIEVNGQRQPIITWRGKILDGRHRMAACRSLGIEPITEARDDLTPDQAVQLVLSHNLHRRHLTRGQIALVGVDLLAAENLPFPKPTQKQLAALLRISDRTLRDLAKRLAEQPELRPAVAAGELAVNAVVEISKLPDDQRVAAIDDIQAGDVEGAKKRVSKAKAVGKSKTKAAEPKQPDNDTPNHWLEHAKFLEDLHYYPALLSAHPLDDEQLDEVIAALRTLIDQLEAQKSVRASDVAA